MMKRIIKCLLLGSALAIAATGCVSWYSTSALPHTRSPSSPEHRQIRSIAFNTEYQVVGVMVSNDMRQSAVDNINAWAEDIFKGSGRYDVTHNKAAADYRLFLHVRDTGKPNRGLAVLCGLTLLVIPAVASDSFEIEAQLVKQDGTVIGRRTLSSEMKMVIEILLFPATPFTMPRSTERKMWREILTELLAWTDAQLNAPQK
jgi:hypothetical protein